MIRELDQLNASVQINKTVSHHYRGLASCPNSSVTYVNSGHLPQYIKKKKKRQVVMEVRERRFK
jgi:hypothetical protein